MNENFLNIQDGSELANASTVGMSIAKGSLLKILEEIIRSKKEWKSFSGMEQEQIAK